MELFRTLLIDEDAIKTHSKQIISSLINTGCEVRVDKKINRFFKNKLKKANELDWKTEYLNSIISIKSVKDVMKQ